MYIYNMKTINIYSILIEPKFRWLRHVILVVSIGLIVVNDIYGIYKGKIDIINQYVTIGSYLLVYLLAAYLNIYLLIPMLLFKKKYIQYIFFLSITSLFFSVGHIYSEYYIHQYYEIPFGRLSFLSEQNPIIALLDRYLMMLFYLTSISSVVFYKQWILNVRKAEQLKAEQFNMELNNLKNRISPDFLFDKLHWAAQYCLTKPPYTSSILLKLSRVLRYQLYDSRREKVLLGSEIKYINDYMTLEKECNDKFDFKITHSELTMNYLIPSSLLISFIEDSLRNLLKQSGQAWINIDLNVTDNVLNFNITDNRQMSYTSEDLHENILLHKRLNLMLNQADYTIISEPDKYLNQYKTVFKYKL